MKINNYKIKLLFYKIIDLLSYKIIINKLKRKNLKNITIIFNIWWYNLFLKIFKNKNLNIFLKINLIKGKAWINELNKNILKYYINLKYWDQKIINFLLKKTKSNYFLTLIDSWTNNTILKLSGGYAYKIGSALNKKRSNIKKQKYQTTLISNKKKKEFKKTSFFALRYILSKSVYKLIELNYNKINWIILTKLQSNLFNSFYFNVLKKLKKKVNLLNIILQYKRSHNGMRNKKLRRL